jgi:PadR family transcriptional regulator, regulatory protein PadR
MRRCAGASLNRLFDLGFYGCYCRYPITDNDNVNQNSALEHRDLYSGLIRLHILYHASKEEIFGLEMMEELGRHGYGLSSGTMYPLLHSLEEKGLLKSNKRLQGSNRRRFYRATPAGRQALKMARERVKELFSELFEDVVGRPGSSKRRSRR